MLSDGAKNMSQEVAIEAGVVYVLSHGSLADSFAGTQARRAFLRRYGQRNPHA